MVASHLCYLLNLLNAMGEQCLSSAERSYDLTNGQSGIINLLWAEGQTVTDESFMSLPRDTGDKYRITTWCMLISWTRKHMGRGHRIHYTAFVLWTTCCVWLSRRTMFGYCHAYGRCPLWRARLIIFDPSYQSLREIATAIWFGFISHSLVTVRCFMVMGWCY